MTSAVGVLARGMRDNPNHIAVWGDDPDYRVQALTGFMGATVDEAGDAAYLETDKEENVGYYERFDFETVGEVDVLGVRNWFMRRSAR